MQEVFRDRFIPKQIKTLDENMDRHTHTPNSSRDQNGIVRKEQLDMDPVILYSIITKQEAYKIRNGAQEN